MPDVNDSLHGLREEIKAQMEAAHSEPVSKRVEVKDLENLFQRAQECAEDLVAEVAAANPGDHPVTVRRRNRDTESARWLLSALPALRIKYNVES